MSLIMDLFATVAAGIAIGALTALVLGAILMITNFFIG